MSPSPATRMSRRDSLKGFNGQGRGVRPAGDGPRDALGDVFDEKREVAHLVDERCGCRDPHEIRSAAADDLSQTGRIVGLVREVGISGWWPRARTAAARAASPNTGNTGFMAAAGLVPYVLR